MRINKFQSLALPVLLFAVLMAFFFVNANSETSKDANESATTITTADKDVLRTVPFLTLRNKTGSDEVAEYFGGERDTLHAGICELARTQINALKSIAEKAPFHIPDEIVKLDAIT